MIFMFFYHLKIINNKFFFANNSKKVKSVVPNFHHIPPQLKFWLWPCLFPPSFHVAQSFITISLPLIIVINIKVYTIAPTTPT